MAEYEVTSLAAGPILMSIRRLSDEFGSARETVSKRLAQFGVQPAGVRNGFPVYRLRDAAQAILGSGITDPNGALDPRLLPPDKRNQWYQSEIRRVELEMSTGRLIPVMQHEADLADVIKSLAQFLETLPDQLERDTSLTPEQVDALHLAIDTQRQALYDRITAPSDEAEPAVVQT